MAEREPHDATANVCDVLETMLSTCGWWTTAELADATGIHRNTLARILGELEGRRWVTRERHPRRGDAWMLGPALPGIGLTFARKLAEAAEALRARLDAAAAFPDLPFPGGPHVR